ncbi:MAG: transcription-repair coupling factor [Chthonomonadales bacterium]
MEFRQLTQYADRLPGFADLLTRLASSAVKVQIEDLAGTAKSLVIARLFERLQPRLLVITPHPQEAGRILDDLKQFGLSPDQLFHLPSPESSRITGTAPDHSAMSDRISALLALTSGDPCVVVGTLDAALHRTVPSEFLQTHTVELVAGASMPMEHLIARLVAMGYEAAVAVARPGEFSRRGGILDVFSSTLSAPVRLEFFGDDIESIRSFDVVTQRSTGRLERVLVGPARETIVPADVIERALPEIRNAIRLREGELASAGKRDALDRLAALAEQDLARLAGNACFEGMEVYLPYLVPQSTCALDYLVAAGTHPSILVVDEPLRVERQFQRIQAELGELRTRRYERGEIFHTEDLFVPMLQALDRVVRQQAAVLISQMPQAWDAVPPDLSICAGSAAMETWRARLTFLADEVAAWRKNGADCFLVTDQPQRVRAICTELGIAVLGDEDTTEIPTGPAVRILEGRLRQGFKFPAIGLYVATDAELFGSTRALAPRRRPKGGIPISTVLDLRPGDYVVHIHHGIGVYRGLVKRAIDGAQRDYLLVEYSGGDRLYVPADQIDRVQRYVGGDGSPPTLNRIGGSDWERTTRRVKEQAKAMARELIELYAARQTAERTPLDEDSPWQREMEESFPYEETPSQLRAIAEVKSDLMAPRPMDRLVCGDVGFGKTEVAIRAAFKVVEAGRQVAVLCPTTVLAAQHHTTFSERLAAYPIRVELLSRFRSRTEQHRTVQALKAGAVDIVVGTHRLLSKDVEFRNLGLVIVDEEQRFGVGHKERLKQLRKTVDVLTLTATPIPRTLSMALSGLRDMSVIEDAPGGRLPIVTHVSEYNEDLIRDAILRELERDGQVYFVHNRVESIDFVAQRVQRLVPDARIRVGHGQMSEDELERIMYDFYHRAFDVLVCTTIIENGLDIPNVNTIIIDRADRMGLAQLYQLRGRVGRSDRQAYAYLFYRRAGQLTEVAEDRLAAIRQFTALGSGFQVAMKDLEIRGAGNLLGPEQSGAMVAVGFDLYCKLLSQAVSELKGEDAVDPTLPAVDLPVTAHIPADYIPNEAERIYFYKRMASVQTNDDVNLLREELEDRYGDPPKAVWNALAILRLRLRARDAGIAQMRGERTQVAIKLAPHARLHPEAVRLLTYAFKGHRFTPDAVIVPIRSPRVLEEAEEMVAVLERAVHYGKNDGVQPVATGGR